MLSNQQFPAAQPQAAQPAAQPPQAPVNPYQGGGGTPGEQLLQGMQHQHAQPAPQQYTPPAAPFYQPAATAPMYSPAPQYQPIAVPPANPAASFYAQQPGQPNPLANQPANPQAAPGAGLPPVGQPPAGTTSAPAGGFYQQPTPSGVVPAVPAWPYQVPPATQSQQPAAPQYPQQAAPPGYQPGQQFTSAPFTSPSLTPASPQDAELQRLRNNLAALQMQLQQVARPAQPGQPWQPGQPPAAAPQQRVSLPLQFDLEQWPEVDAMLIQQWRETKRNPDGTTFTDWRADTPDNIRAAGNHYMQHVRTWETALLAQPHKVLPQIIEKIATQVAERISGEKIAANDNMARVDSMCMQHDWLFAQDPTTGQVVLSPYGRQWIAYAEYDPAKPPTANDVRSLDSALRVVRLQRENDMLRGGMQPSMQPGQVVPPQQGQVQVRGIDIGGYTNNPQASNGYQPPLTNQQQFVQQQPYAAAPQYPQGQPQPPGQLDWRIDQLNRMAMNHVNRAGSFPINGSIPNTLPSQQPSQNPGLSAGQKLMANMGYQGAR